MPEFVVKITMLPNSRSVPGRRFFGLPPGGTYGQIPYRDPSIPAGVFWGDAPGGGGGADTRTLPAGETISALRVARIFSGQVFAVTSNESENEVDSIIGVTLTAGDLGDPVTVKTSGEITDSSWSWATGRVFLGPTGALTQTPPTTGASLVMGFATAPNKFNLAISEAVFIED